MPPKKDSTSSDKNDDLIAAFRDERVLEAIGNVFENKLQKLVADVSILTADLVKAKEEIGDLKVENERLKNVVQNNSARLEQLDSYSKLDNLLIKALLESYAAIATNEAEESTTVSPREYHDTTLAQVINLCQNYLKVNISAGDISVVHRLPKGRNDAVRPVIVRFANRRSRDSIYKARKELRNSRPVASPIYINEHLTRKADELFLACRRSWKNRKIASTWTWNGNVFIKRLDRNGGDIVKVHNLEELNNV